MAGGQSPRGGAITGINITPLVDIMLVLVIILMVTAEFTRYKTVSVNLPKINAAAQQREPVKVTVTLKPDKTIYIDNRRVASASELNEQLKNIRGARTDFAVILRAESATQYGDLLKLLDGIKSSGISRIGLAVEAAAGK